MAAVTPPWVLVVSPSKVASPPLQRRRRWRPPSSRQLRPLPFALPSFIIANPSRGK
ncbi:putative FAST kinase domain-containing protein 1 [Sesbania bispinosa]|nr:putative FAST kinase domain-containing protein 1 [Sesbania bispinosa]